MNQTILKKLRKAQKKILRNNPIKFSKIVVVVVIIGVWCFTREMIELFRLYGAVPDTLIMAFYTVSLGEGGILGLLRIFVKDKDVAASDGSDDIAKG